MSILISPESRHGISKIFDLNFVMKPKEMCESPFNTKVHSRYIHHIETTCRPHTITNRHAYYFNLNKTGIHERQINADPGSGSEKWR